MAQSHTGHNKRRAVCLHKYDYVSCGYYLVTLPAYDGKPLFARPSKCASDGGGFELTEAGKIIDENLNMIYGKYKNVLLDKYCVTPACVYAIIIIELARKAHVKPAPPLATIISEFKTSCIEDYRDFIEERSLHMSAKLWQRNYQERGINNDTELTQAREDIIGYAGAV